MKLMGANNTQVILSLIKKSKQQLNQSKIKQKKALTDLMRWAPQPSMTGSLQPYIHNGMHATTQYNHIPISWHNLITYHIIHISHYISAAHKRRHV